MIDLKVFLHNQGFTTVHTLGFSGGGLGALHYGDAIAAETCTVFSPPSLVPACDDHNDIRGLALRRRLAKLNLLAASDVAARFASVTRHPRTRVYYPTLSPADAYHADRLRPFSHVAFFPQEVATHAFWGRWDTSCWTEVMSGW